MWIKILKVVDSKDTSSKGTDSERYDWNTNFHPQRHMRTFNYLWKRTCAHGYSNTPSFVFDRHAAQQHSSTTEKNNHNKTRRPINNYTMVVRITSLQPTILPPHYQPINARRSRTKSSSHSGLVSKSASCSFVSIL